MTTFNKIVLEKTLLMNILIRMIKMKVTKKNKLIMTLTKNCSNYDFLFFLNDRKNVVISVAKAMVNISLLKIIQSSNLMTKMLKL